MMRKRVLVIGGLGYVGSRLVQKLIRNYDINILDTGWFWEDIEEAKDVLSSGSGRSPQIFIGDMRDKAEVRRAMNGCHAAILLACISNDPSSDLDPKITESISCKGSKNVLDVACAAQLERFIYASSSSVYGIKTENDVIETLKLEPLTQYAELKVAIEKEVLYHTKHGFLNGIIVRPATVCGYSPRQRLDLVVNIFINQSLQNGKIVVTGGDNYRPNIGINRMTDCYQWLLEGYLPDLVGEIFNVGSTNYTVKELASLVQSGVKKLVGKDVEIEEIPTTDKRSYRLNSDKIKARGFEIYGIDRDIQELILTMSLYEQYKNTDTAPVLNLSKSSNIEVMKVLIEKGLK